MTKEKNLTDLKLIITKLEQNFLQNPYDLSNCIKLGDLHYHLKQIDDAINYYKRCCVISPQNFQIHFKLANCYVQVNSIEAAINHYSYCLKLNPAYVAASQNLGILLLTDENFTAALPYLEQAYTQDPSVAKNVAFIEQLANCYLHLGNTSKAIELFKQGINLNPNSTTMQHNLAILYLREQNSAMAQHHFVRALHLDPTNNTAQHMLNSLQNTTTNLPPQNYIVDLFNQYANYYEQHVTTTLKYNLPAIFRNLYAKHAHTINAINTLDLGVGTGLCGIYFRDATINLIGVDLATNMLLEAQKKQAYDLLIETALPKNNVFKLNYFDLILAADLLPYLGRLEELFDLVAKNLTIASELNKLKLPNMFISNIELLIPSYSETAPEATKPASNESARCNLTTHHKIPNFKLQPNGRYAHSIDYITTLAKKFNFVILEQLETTIRTELNLPVIGVIFVFTYPRTNY